MLESYAFDLELSVRLEKAGQCLIPNTELEVLQARCKTQEESLKEQKVKIDQYEGERILLATELHRQIELEKELNKKIIEMSEELERRRKKEEERQEEERKIEQLINTVKKGMEEFGL